MQEVDPLDGHPRYEMIRWIDRKMSSFVLLARDKTTGQEVAIKCIPRGPRINKQVEREVLNHLRLNHPHVIKFKRLFLTSYHLAIVMEYAPGGTLHRYIKEHNGSIPEKHIRWIFQQSLIALDYIHKSNVVNRDIKLANVLFGDTSKLVIKICDFGFSKHSVRDSLSHTQLGTKPFAAPEVLIMPEPDSLRYSGEKADIWSAGAVLYVMVAHEYPLTIAGKNMEEHEAMIKQKLEELDNKEGTEDISQECKDYIKMILICDPTKRPTIAELQQHPWYQKDLPEGALALNDNLRYQQPQSNNDIIRLLREARR